MFSGSTSSLKGESEGRINILLLGYGGEGHDGPFLTDTIILASINPETKQVALTSLPAITTGKTENKRLILLLLLDINHAMILMKQEKKL